MVKDILIFDPGEEKETTWSVNGAYGMDAYSGQR